MVVKTPGLSRYRPEVARLTELGIPVVGGLGLWLAEADLRRVLVVTGTKGKSTTSSVTGHLLAGLGYRCMLGGNIGAPPYDPAEDGDFDYWVIEVSSYQATDLPCSPPVVAVTSLHPDHLDWHGGVEQYYRDKLSACSQPGAELTVANGDSDLLRERAGLLGPRVEWVREDDEPGADWMEPLGLPGRHNRRNALIARRCLVALGVPGAGDDARLRAAAAGYQPLPSRLAPAGTVGGVTFVDDSLSTNVLPTLAALDAFPGRRIALIVGGQDRGIDYAPLAAGVLARRAPTYVLTLPDSGPRIRAAIEQAAGNQTSRPVRGRGRLSRPRRRRAGGVPLGTAGWRGAAVPGRAELRAVQGLPRSRRSLRPRCARAFLLVEPGQFLNPVTARIPGGSSASPTRVPTVACTPWRASSPGIRDVSTSTFSCRSPLRRQAPAPSGTNVVMSRTYRSGVGAENSVMTAQSGPTRPTFSIPARTLENSRSQMSIASTPPGRSAPAMLTRTASTAAASGR